MASLTAAEQKEKSTLYGIGFMLLNALSVSIIYVVAKVLTKEMSSHLVVFLYKFSILVLILPWVFSSGFKTLKTNRIGLHLSRGFLSICGSLSLYYAIKHIELADITAVGYLEQVVLVVIGVLYFKERSTFAKALGITLSFVGAVMVVYPEILDIGRIAAGEDVRDSVHKINPYYAFVFLSIAFWATNSTVVKVLGKTEKTKVQLFYVLLFSSIIAYPLAFMKWKTLGHIGSLELRYPVEFIALDQLGLKWEHWKHLSILAICYFTHSVSFFKALKHADLSTVIPFDYSRLVFAGIFGYVFFAEEPEVGSYIGYALIIIAGVYLVKSEAQYRKKLRKEKIMQLESEYEHS